MVESIKPSEAAAMIAHDDVLIVDVRDADEWSAGHLPGAQPVPLDQLRADPDRALHHAPTILFVCAKGARSLTAAKMAERLGYAKLYSLDGGTREWAAAGLPLVVEYTAPPSGGAAGAGQARTVEHTASPSGGAAGAGQARTVEHTASPSGGAAGAGQARTVEHTAPPSGGADGAGQARTVEQRVAA